MDGDDQFAHAVAAYRVQRAASAVPALLLVSVGYRASYMKPANRRMRDYTPTAMAGEPGTGGGDAFLRFLTGELWPELERRYAIDLAVKGIARHSLGSFLALQRCFDPSLSSIACWPAAHRSGSTTAVSRIW